MPAALAGLHRPGAEPEAGAPPPRCLCACNGVCARPDRERAALPRCRRHPADASWGLIDPLRVAPQRSCRRLVATNRPADCLPRCENAIYAWSTASLESSTWWRTLSPRARTALNSIEKKCCASKGLILSTAPMTTRTGALNAIGRYRRCWTPRQVNLSILRSGLCSPPSGTLSGPACLYYTPARSGPRSAGLAGFTEGRPAPAKFCRRLVP